MYRVQNIHGCGLKVKKQTMMGSRGGCSGGEILLGSPVALAPSSGASVASFPNLSKLDIPKLKSKMKKISF
jgi:hypothetical protein